MMSEPRQGSDRLTDLSTRLRAAEEARARYTDQDPRSQGIAFRAAVVFLAGTVVALAGAAFWIAAYSALFACGPDDPDVDELVEGNPDRAGAAGTIEAR